MKKYLIVITLGVLILLISQNSVFSGDETRQKALAMEVNDYAVEKLGLSLEEIALLFSFKRKRYFGPEVIDGVMEREHMGKLLEAKYITLEKAPDLGLGIPDSKNHYYFPGSTLKCNGQVSI